MGRIKNMKLSLPGRIVCYAQRSNFYRAINQLPILIEFAPLGRHKADMIWTDHSVFSFVPLPEVNRMLLTGNLNSWRDYLLRRYTLHTSGRGPWPREELIDEQAGELVLSAQLQSSIEIFLRFSREAADDVRGDWDARHAVNHKIFVQLILKRTFKFKYRSRKTFTTRSKSATQYSRFMSPNTESLPDWTGTWRKA